MNYDLTKTELTTLKTRLTRAKNSGDPERVINEVNRALTHFEAKGYPDCWQQWPRAKADAQSKIARGFPFNLTKS